MTFQSDDARLGLLPESLFASAKHINMASSLHIFDPQPDATSTTLSTHLVHSCRYLRELFG